MLLPVPALLPDAAAGWLLMPLAAELNMPLSGPPMVETEPAITAAMSTPINAYSTDVTARRSLHNLRAGVGDI